MKNFLLIAIALFVTGCAYTPMTVELQPDTTVTASDIGAGQTLYMLVRDERTEKEIGRRGTGMMQGAKISLEEDLAAVVQGALTDMLTTKGFQISAAETDANKPFLRVDVRGLEYATSTGFWTGGVQVSAALKATANGRLASYDDFYRYESEDRVVVVPGADGNNERINEALNDVLQQLVNDQKLLEVLAETDVN